MSDRQPVWVDGDRCTGCGACVAVCPVGAIALADGKARVDGAPSEWPSRRYGETCTGCGACVDACPEDAILPVVQGELVVAPEQPSPTVYQPGRLARTAGGAVAVAGAGLLLKAAQALARAVGRWLTQRPVATKPRAQRTQNAVAEAPPSTGGRRSAGRRSRHRWRGG